MKKTALLVIDVQNGLFWDEEPPFEGERLLSNIKILLKKAREKRVPIVYIRHTEPAGMPLEEGTDAWQIHPEIAPRPEDILIQKTTPDSFKGTHLEDKLKKLGIARLVIAGMQTEMCVDTTCRRAFSLGYDVILAKDAHTTYDSPVLKAKQIIDHHNGVLRWFADTAETKDVEF